MLKRTLKAAVLALFVFASAMMLVAVVITSALRSALAGAAVTISETKADTGYTLRSYNGRIAVFYGDIKNSPAIETTIDVDTLRAVDQEKLDAGIVVETYDEVLRLLEDFGS